MRAPVCVKEGKGGQTARRSSLHAHSVIPLLPAGRAQWPRGCGLPGVSWSSCLDAAHLGAGGSKPTHTTRGKCSSGSAYARGGSWSSLHIGHGLVIDVGSAGLQSRVECGRVHPVHPQLLHLSLAAIGGGRSQWLSQRRGVLCVCSKLPSASHPHQWGAPRLSIGQESLLHSSYVVYSTLHVFSCLFHMCFFTLKYISGLLGI